MFKKKPTDSEDGKRNLLSNYSTRSRYAEAYRTLRTNLQFACMDRELKSVLFTSAVEKEGKTNSVANLAHTVAQSGKSVLIMDADLRKPALSKRLNAKHATGITQIITDVLGARITQGAIRDYSLSDLVRLNKLQKNTGALTLTDDENEVAIYLLRGELTDIYWKNRPDSKKLAAVLVGQNLLTQEQAFLALGHQKKSVQRLGALLITMGLLTRDTLKGPLAVHMMEAFKIAAGMTEGHFTFTPRTEEEITGINNHGMDFDNLFKESLEEDIPYISKTIDGFIFKTETENLYLLPSGSPPSNPSELIGSARMTFLLEILKTKFDLLVIDSSPIVPASDALLLAPQTDGVVLVVKPGLVNRKLAMQAVDKLRNAQANILGAVINQVDLKKDTYYRYYSRYYRGYYGEK